jgi:hypothetical protein
MACLLYTLCTMLTGSSAYKGKWQGIKSLAPRVKALAGQLCGPIPEGDIKEQKRERNWKSKPAFLKLRSESDKKWLLGSWKNVLQELGHWRSKERLRVFSPMLRMQISLQAWLRIFEMQ